MVIFIYAVVNTVMPDNINTKPLLLAGNGIVPSGKNNFYGKGHGKLPRRRGSLSWKNYLFWKV